MGLVHRAKIKVKGKMIKGVTVKTMGLSRKLVVILDRTISVTAMAEAMAGVVMEKEANLPGKTIMIIRDRPPRKMIHKEIVVVEEIIIKVEAGGMTSTTIQSGVQSKTPRAISVYATPFYHHLHHMILTGN